MVEIARDRQREWSNATRRYPSAAETAHRPVAAKPRWGRQALEHLAWILNRKHGVREFPGFILAIIVMFLVVNCMLVAVFFMPKGG